MERLAAFSQLRRELAKPHDLTRGVPRPRLLPLRHNRPATNVVMVLALVAFLAVAGLEIVALGKG